MALIKQEFQQTPITGDLHLPTGPFTTICFTYKHTASMGVQSHTNKLPASILTSL